MSFPKRGDKSDLRCGLVENGCTDGKVTPDHWCFGCQQYICDGCSEVPVASRHDVMEHRDDLGDDPEDDE